MILSAASTSWNKLVLREVPGPTGHRRFKKPTQNLRLRSIEGPTTQCAGCRRHPRRDWPYYRGYPRRAYPHRGTGTEYHQQHHVPLNWTTAEKSDVRNYAEGQVLEIHRAVKGVARHESLEVVGVEDGKVVARNARGEERQFTAKQAKCFDVYERRTIEIAPNDKLLLMSNRREPGFRATNGELVTVSRIDEQGRIHLQDGRALPENYKQFTHGYAVTAHRSQGKSVMPLSSPLMGCGKSCSTWLLREAVRASRL